MSSERNLVSKVLQTRDLTDLVDGGVTPNFFLVPEHRQAYEMIVAHRTQYGVVPTVETFKRDYPTYKIAEAGDALSFYIDAVRENYRRDILENGIVNAMEFYEDDNAPGAAGELARTLAHLNEEISLARAVDITQTGGKRMQRYHAYSADENSLKGISSGFAAIDAATGGFQKKQLITFAGPPKAGKSTILLLAMMAAHRMYYRPLFIGFEMTNEEQEERHDAIRAGLSHKKLREGRLSGEEFRIMERMHRRLESMPPMIFSEDAASSMTLSGVASQIDRYEPDIVFVDGVYMMDDEQGEKKGSPQALTNITRGFKQQAKNYDLPVAISTQVLEWKMDRKRGVTSNSIGYSSSFVQDSDQVIAVEKTDEPDVNKLKVVLGRNNPGMEVFVKWDWETGSFEEMEDGYDPTSTDDDGDSNLKF